MSGPQHRPPPANDDPTSSHEPRPTSHIEVETKLDADADFVMPELSAALGPDTDARAGEPIVLDLQATYFDTARLDLVASKVTLRRRTGGQDDGWHLKLPANAGSRTEIGVPLDAVPGGDEDTDGAASAVPSALASLVIGLSRGRRLRPVARFTTTRTVQRMLRKDGTTLVEIADDAVSVVRLLPGADRRPQQWREIEVEVIDGSAEQMTAVADLLLASGAHASGSASKLARALGVDGTGETPARPRKPSTGAADVDGSHGANQQTTENAGSVILAGFVTYRRQLLGADVALRQHDPDAEALHDARAAARRIRSMLQVFEPLFLPGSVHRVSARLRRLGSSIGAARDHDVVADRLLTALDPTADRPRGTAPRPDGLKSFREHVAARAAKRRSHHVKRLRRIIGAKAYVRTLRSLDDLIERPPLTTLAARPASEVLPPLLTAAWYRLWALAEAAIADPEIAEKAHEVRKTAKAVRYAAETAASALGTGTARFAEYAESIQDILGTHHDAVTTAAMVSDPRPGSLAAGLPPTIADHLREAEERAAARAFGEFVVLWTARPDRAEIPVPESRSGA